MELLILALAVHQAVNVYRYSSLFAEFRQAREIGQPIAVLPESWQDKVRELLLCPWCMSVHVALVLALLFWVGSLSVVLWPLRLVVYALAVSQVANLLHVFTGHKGAS